MGAYNNLILSERCPACGAVGDVAIQMHAAASYDGDAAGRFHGFTYHVGDRLLWWPQDDSRYHEWTDDPGLVLRTDGTSATEFAYGVCLSCKTDLICTVCYADLSVAGVSSLTIEPK